MPAVRVAVEALTCAGCELTAWSLIVIRLRAPIVVVPSVCTVTGPLVPRVSE